MPRQPNSQTPQIAMPSRCDRTNVGRAKLQRNRNPIETVANSNATTEIAPSSQYNWSVRCDNPCRTAADTMAAN